MQKNKSVYFKLTFIKQMVTYLYVRQKERKIYRLIFILRTRHSSDCLKTTKTSKNEK